jgi:hypothetical protein
MFKRFLLSAVCIGATIGLGAQERLDLTTPETKPTNPTYTISLVTFDWERGTVIATLKGTNGELLTKVYTGSTAPTGISLMIALNKSNNSTTSLQKRIFLQLQADIPALAGAINGTPQ